MIDSKSKLVEYLKSDKASLRISKNYPSLFSDEIWKYEIALRFREYYTNVQLGLFGKVMRYFWTFVHHRLSVKLGLQVPINVCDKGLHINHHGLLIISPDAKIGKNFDVHQGVNIGVNVEKGSAPIIGNNVFCGPGVKMFGSITIADNIAIAAGSVVTKSFTTPNITIGGVPAKIINSNKGNPYV